MACAPNVGNVSVPSEREVSQGTLVGYRSRSRQGFTVCGSPTADSVSAHRTASTFRCQPLLGPDKRWGTHRMPRNYPLVGSSLGATEFWTRSKVPDF